MEHKAPRKIIISSQGSVFVQVFPRTGVEELAGEDPNAGALGGAGPRSRVLAALPL